MMKFILSLCLLIILLSCASKPKSEPKIALKGNHYISPGGSIGVEILLEENVVEKIHPKSSLSKLKLRPGTVIPKHSHSSDEYLYFIKGAGEIEIAGEKKTVEDGMVVFIPEGTKHAYVNDSKKEAHAIQVYSCAGPEQRFKKWDDI